MNKKILIFGGTGAIGFSIAKSLKNHGYNPLLISRNKDDLINKSKEIDCDYQVCDVLEANQIEEVSKKHNEDVFGLAYCIGSINLRPLKITKDIDFIDSFKINTLGAINVFKSNLASLTNNNGSVLFFSTIAVQQGFTNHSIISSAKAAIEGLTVALAAELAPSIRINCIAPSLTKSKMSSSVIRNSAIESSIARMHPLKRIGEGLDSANLASFLLTNKSSWITGQIIGVDGGRSNIT